MISGIDSMTVSAMSTASTLVADFWSLLVVVVGVMVFGWVTSLWRRQ